MEGEVRSYCCQRDGRTIARNGWRWHLLGMTERQDSALEKLPPGTGTPPLRTGIGLALGGGFARGFAHLGVLKVLRQHQISVRSECQPSSLHQRLAALTRIWVKTQK